MINLVIVPLDWDAMLGKQMNTLFFCELLARRRGEAVKTNTHEDNECSRSFDQRWYAAKRPNN